MPASSRIENVDVTVLEVPTDRPESDGTFEWTSTTVVLVEAHAGGVAGIGYTYGAAAGAQIIADLLVPVVAGRDAFAIGAAWDAMVAQVRNAGRSGVAATAISAVDIALWDLRARLLGVSLVDLLGGSRERVAAYASGGFTSYSLDQLEYQLAGWVDAGFRAVKMKVGRELDADRRRVAAARKAVGEAVDLMVDGNGAYTPKQALAFADAFASAGVCWFEEPVSSDDLDGLRFVRNHAPAGVEVSAGEYGWDPWYFERMLAAGAVDVVQPDVSRCGGVTGFMRAATVADAHQVDVSAHCVPQVSAHVCAAVPRVRHVEYFHDHARIERRIFDGALVPTDGFLVPDRSRPGIGVELRRPDTEQFVRSAA